MHRPDDFSLEVSIIFSNASSSFRMHHHARNLHKLFIYLLTYMNLIVVNRTQISCIDWCWCFVSSMHFATMQTTEGFYFCYGQSQWLANISWKTQTVQKFPGNDCKTFLWLGSSLSTFVVTTSPTSNSQLRRIAPMTCFLRMDWLVVSPRMSSSSNQSWLDLSKYRKPAMEFILLHEKGLDLR